MENIIKEFFLPGDLCVLKKDLENKPKSMMVVKKATKTMTISGVKNEYFQGMECMWFTKEGDLKTHIFNTKDISKIK